MSGTQLSFDLFSGAPSRKKENQESNIRRWKYHQAVLGWLVPQGPSGIGMNVPTRVSKFQVDFGAFWSSPDRKKIMRVRKTMIVEMRFDREDCWPEISDREQLLKKLHQIKGERKNLEAVIRRDEPELRVADNLFEEIEDWNYEASKNPEYHSCLKRLENIQHALYAGSRFEQIRRAHVADYLFLAVPRHLIDPSELANGWGLLYINDDHSVEEVKKAQQEETCIDNKLHFIQNLASACMKNVLFSAGINLGGGEKINYTLPPRRRRKEI